MGRGGCRGGGCRGCGWAGLRSPPRGAPLGGGADAGSIAGFEDDIGDDTPFETRAAAASAQAWAESARRSALAARAAVTPPGRGLAMHSRRLARFPDTVMFVETVHLSEEFLPQQPFQPPPGGEG